MPSFRDGQSFNELSQQKDISSIANPYAELRECNGNYIDDFGNLCTTDDNGKTYKVNDTVVPNCSYEHKGIKYKSDDKGTIFIKDGKLISNIEYKVNGYDYRTDEKGRIISAEGTLRLKERESRNPINENMNNIARGYELNTDERGHLIADLFDGSNKIENLIPMDANLNKGEYKSMEMYLSKAVADGKSVRLEVRPAYDKTSFRPSHIIATYSINGEISRKNFINKGADKNEQ